MTNQLHEKTKQKKKQRFVFAGRVLESMGTLCSREPYLPPLSLASPSSVHVRARVFGFCVNLNSKQRSDFFSGRQRPLFMRFRTCLFIRKPLRLPCCRGGKINLWQYKLQGLHYGNGFRRAARTRLGLEINKAMPVCIFETGC